MSRPTLHIGNRNFSSWSLRPWIAFRHLGLDFDTRVVPLDTPQFRQDLAALDVAGRVPVLVHGEIRVWDSLAICEYGNELAGGRGWPPSTEVRAVARSVSCEMHSGFAALRSQMPMNIRARRRVAMTPELQADIARIETSWGRARQKHAASGPWLFGAYCIADAMYAPVALRFATYGTELGPVASAYRDTVLADPLLGEWITAAREESWTLPQYDVGEAVV
jgi:glutathione S-transferase